jgi:hypothetical protein
MMNSLNGPGKASGGDHFGQRLCSYYIIPAEPKSLLFDILARLINKIRGPGLFRDFSNIPCLVGSTASSKRHVRIQINHKFTRNVKNNKTIVREIRLNEYSLKCKCRNTNSNLTLRSVRALSRTSAICLRGRVNAGKSGITIATIRAHDCAVFRPIAIIRSIEEMDWTPITRRTSTAYPVVGDAIR